jgi:predicted extracellular nuclease
VVLADLSVLGGDAAQRLRDEGTDGDVTAGDGTYSYQLTVTTGESGSAHLIPFGVGDAEGRTGTATLPITVATLVPIHAIQGSGTLSPLAGQTVVTEGIVTARRNNGFYVQAADGEGDLDAATSEGLFVFTSSVPPTWAAITGRVRVQGKVAEFVPSSNPHQLTVTELTAPTVSLLSMGNALPAPVVIHDSGLLRADALDSMERLEGMRVAADLVVAAPGGGFINEANATSTTDGVFYGVLSGVARPMREPGVSVLDTTPFPAGINPPRFDSNPERLRVQSTAQPGAAAIAVDVGDRVDGLVGVLDYAFGAYNLLPDPQAQVVLTPGSTPRAAAAPASDEITIAGFNLLRFFDDVNAPSISDPVLTPDALAHRLRKTANAICGYVNAPDILGVVEVENLVVLQRLAATINAGDTQEPGACPRNPRYEAILVEGNDVGGIDVGFLVSTADVGTGQPRVEVLEVEQLGKDATLANPDGSTSLLNDRPSLLLRARVHHGNGATREVTVIVNHLRSLSDANSMEPGTNGWATAGERVRAKRAAQARFVGEVVEARQNADPFEALVLLGDFNAFEFSDGYVDSMGILGGDAAVNGSVLTYVPSPVTRPLVNLAQLLPEGERYSFSFDGNAQSLDHLLVSQGVFDAGLGVRGDHARINADFGEDNFGDWTVPVRVSDHDPVVLYLRDAAAASVDLAVSVASGKSEYDGGEPALFGVGVANGGPSAASPVRLTVRVDSADALFHVYSPEGWSCGVPVPEGDGQRADCSADGPFAAGAQAGIQAWVEAPFWSDAPITVSAAVDTTMHDTAPGNDAAAATVAIIAHVDLAAAIQLPSPVVAVGSELSFGIGVANGSESAARSPELTLTLGTASAAVAVTPADGWTCSAPVVASVTTVRCAADSAPAGSQAGFVVRLPVGDALGGQRLGITAEVASVNKEVVWSNNRADAYVDVSARADLAVKVLAPKGPLKVSNPGVFTVGVGNAGPDTARGVVVGLALNTPASGVLGFDAPGWTCGVVAGDAGTSRWACQRAAFAVGSSANALRVSVAPRAAGSLTLAASIAAGSDDPQAGNNTSTASVKVVGK